MIITEMEEEPTNQPVEVNQAVNHEEAAQAEAQDEPEIVDLGDVDPAVLVQNDEPEKSDGKPNVLDELEANLPERQIEMFREMLKESGMQDSLDGNADLTKDDIRKLIGNARGNGRKGKNQRRGKPKKGKTETESDGDEELVMVKRKIQKKKKMGIFPGFSQVWV